MSRGPTGCGASGLSLGALSAVAGAHSTLIAGSPADFRLTLSSTASASCSVTPGVEFTVTSGKDRIWTTADCPLVPVGTAGPGAVPTLAGIAQGILSPAAATLGPGASVTFDIVWPGVRSVGSCTAGAPALRPGTYIAEVTVDGVGSARAVFDLS